MLFCHLEAKYSPKPNANLNPNSNPNPNPCMHFMFWPRRSYAKQTHRHTKQLFFILEPGNLYANLKKLYSVAKWKGSPAHFSTSYRLSRRTAVFGVSRSAFGALRLPPFSIALNFFETRCRLKIQGDFPAAIGS